MRVLPFAIVSVPLLVAPLAGLVACSQPQRTAVGCQKDTDCKGERICDDGKCGASQIVMTTAAAAPASACPPCPVCAPPAAPAAPPAPAATPRPPRPAPTGHRDPMDPVF